MDSDLILMNQRKNSRTVLTLVQLRLSHHPRKKRKKIDFFIHSSHAPMRFWSVQSCAKMRARKKKMRKSQNSTKTPHVVESWRFSSFLHTKTRKNEAIIERNFSVCSPNAPFLMTRRTQKRVFFWHLLQNMSPLTHHATKSCVLKTSCLVTFKTICFPSLISPGKQ